MKCQWCLGSKLYEDYHDLEWGIPTYKDDILFEFLVLESAQAGLSWITILKKRENYRLAYDNFDVNKVSKYDSKKIEELMANEGIVRYRKKIEASINNANKFIEIQNEWDSFSNYIWSFTNNKVINNNIEATKDLPSKSNLSDIIYKDMKKRGFKFLGSTTIYSYLQAMGIINDHITSCFKHKTVKQEQNK